MQLVKGLLICCIFLFANILNAASPIGTTHDSSGMTLCLDGRWAKRCPTAIRPVAPIWDALEDCPDGPVGEAYSCDISSNVSGNYTPSSSLNFGDLVSFGLSIDSNFVISGTPTLNGNPQIRVLATNSAGATESSLISFNIAGGSVASSCTFDPQVFGYGAGTGISRTLTYSAGDTTTGVDFNSASCGYFYDGTQWIVPSAGVNVTLTAATPTPTSTRNRLLANPSGVTETADSRLDSGGATLSFPHVIDTSAQAIMSLMVTDSWNDAGAYTETVGGLTRMAYEQKMIVTVLDSIPAGNGQNHIRPAYFGSSKSLKALSDFNVSLLPNLGIQSRPSGSFTPSTSITDCIAFMDAGVKIDSLQDLQGIQGDKGYANWPGTSNGYSPNGYGPLLECLAWLTLDPNDFAFTSAQKTELFYKTMVHAMDALQIVLDAGTWVWGANGGHAPGRYILALMGAVFQNDTTDLTAFQAIMANAWAEHIFPETGQIVTNNGSYPVYGANNVTGGRAIQDCSGSDFANSIAAEAAGNVDIGDFTHYPTVVGDCVYTDLVNDYQDITFPIFFTQTYLCRAIPALTPYCDQELMDYVDRVYTSGTISYVGNNPANGTQYNRALAYCNNGTNDQLLGFGSGDCPGGTWVPAIGTNFDNTVYNCEFCAFMYEQQRTCLLAGNCTGQ